LNFEAIKFVQLIP